MEELHLTPAQFGLAGSAIFFLFGIFSVFGGMMANRWPTRWMLPAMALIWSLVQFPMLFTTSFVVLLLSRTVLGMAPA